MLDEVLGELNADVVEKQENKDVNVKDKLRLLHGRLSSKSQSSASKNSNTNDHEQSEVIL